MHLVVGYDLDLHGAERSPADVQRDESRLDTVKTYLLQETRRDVQACRGRGDAAALAGVDRLVPFSVF